ncbi:MAG: ABC transporter permease [Actinobacteria bacterium]|jgi:osmoprotectant transport system permease protein|nr:ABC transporter permease [Actinomycetota bacterium]MCO5298731.1 ABC transporter permease [Candidatus Nanopelagicales bacterium]MCB9428939.1 ABC transporter permease [Actinomycetota bacterium]HPE13441.1 ABC transporter permease [Actinomycetota bacterium]HPJ19816.1 ABC transporter permease [Actinomycetota bacterium]
MSATVADASNPWISWSYVQDNWSELVAAGQEHIYLTVGSVILAVVVAVPLAMVIRRSPKLSGPILGLSGVLYTIPSLALISLLWPVFGLSPWTVIIALAVYALLVVLRNMVVGLQEVPADVLDAANGMGLTDRQILTRVSLPLALPTILAGIRIATVSTVGMVTIGALVGYGGFGTLILSGFQNNFWHAQILTATVCCVLLATLFEVLLLVVERVSVPWTRKQVT